MAETKEKKGFRAGAYAVISGVLVAVVLVGITIFAFTSRYTAFSPDKVAQAYVDTIVQTGDGYNSYKNTLVSKNQKFGNFVINAYMAPYVNEDAPQAEFVGSGTEEEMAAIDEVYNTMYDYYLDLLNRYGLDNYDAVFSNYFAKLTEVRRTVYKDEYMDTEFMFGAFESNVSEYGKSLTGTAEEIAQDGKTVLQEKTTGTYQTMYGEDYRLTARVTDTTALSADEVSAYISEYKERISPIASSGEAKAAQFGLEDKTTEKKILFFTQKSSDNKKSDMIGAFNNLDCSDSISAVDKCIVEVSLDDGTVVATQEVYVVQIGNSWYVDETNIDTSALYLAK